MLEKATGEPRHQSVEATTPYRARTEATSNSVMLQSLRSEEALVRDPRDDYAVGSAEFVHPTRSFPVALRRVFGSDTCTPDVHPSAFAE